MHLQLISLLRAFFIQFLQNLDVNDNEIKSLWLIGAILYLTAKNLSNYPPLLPWTGTIVNYLSDFLIWQLSFVFPSHSNMKSFSLFRDDDTSSNYKGQNQDSCIFP